MADYTITVPVGIATRVADAICDRYGYVSGSKADFVKSVIAEFIRKEVKAQEKEVREVQRVANHQAATDSEEAQAAIDDIALDAIA
jgi:hypothetical protein